MDHDEPTSDWVEQVCTIALRWRHEHSSISDLFAPATAHLDDRAAFIAAITPWIEAHPDVIEAWQGYSEDKRSSPSPYFGRQHDLVVGFYDGSFNDEVYHTGAVAACVDFIYREASWVLRGRRER